MFLYLRGCGFIFLCYMRKKSDGAQQKLRPVFENNRANEDEQYICLRPYAKLVKAHSCSRK